MDKKAKSKQIAVRFDNFYYEKVKFYADEEHRGLGEFIRHATLCHISHLEKLEKQMKALEGKGK